MEADAHAADLSDPCVRDRGGERERPQQCVYCRERRGCRRGHLPARVVLAQRQQDDAGAAGQGG